MTATRALPRHLLFSWGARGVLIATLASLQGGCTRTPSAPASPTPAPPPPAAPDETFTLSGVRLQYDEPRERLSASYSVSNRTARHAGGYLCVDLIDKNGDVIDRAESLDRIGLRAADSEDVLDRQSPIPADVWEATARLRLYMTRRFCPVPDNEPRSQVLWLDRSGHPLPAGLPPGSKSSGSEDPPRPWFQLKDARLTQTARGEVRVSYTLTNLTQGRVSSRLCAQLTQGTRCACRGRDEASSPDISLGRGESVSRTTALTLQDSRNWDRGQQLTLFMSSFGCVGSPEQATSNRLTLAKPRSIHAPEQEAPDE